MTDFLLFEIQKEPGRVMMRSGTKSDILHCLNTPTCHSDATMHYIVVIVNKAAVGDMVHPALAKPLVCMFQCTSFHFWSFKWLTVPNNLMLCRMIIQMRTLTHQKCGLGSRIRVGSGSAPIPRHEWKRTILKNENKRMNSLHPLAKNHLERVMLQCMPCTTNSFLLNKVVLNQFSAVDINGMLLLTTYIEIVIRKRHIILITLALTQRQTPTTRISTQLAHAYTTTNVCSVASDILVARYFNTYGLSEL